MGLFKRASVRGMAHAMVNRGLVNFPSKQAMDAAADMVADGLPPSMPEVAPPGGHGTEDVAAIAQKLIEIGTQLQAQAGIGGPPSAPMPMPSPPPGEGGGEPSGPPPEQKEEAAKEAAYLYGEATHTPRGELAYKAASAVMEKAAAEKQASGGGALMQGGDKQNTPAEAAKNDSVAGLDQKQRPAGAYTGSQGHTELETAKGEIGNQGSPTVSPTNSPSGSNSVTKDSHKSAGLLKLRDSLKQAASTLIGVASPGSTKNKEKDSKQNDSVAQLDLKNRSVDEYRVSPGGANFSEGQDTRTGKEQPHPKAPSNSPSGTNSVIQASKAAELNEESAFLFLFDKCASDVGRYLPKVMTDEQKVAAIKDMIAMDRDGRQAYLDRAYDAVKKASESTTAPQLPTNKEASLLERVRNAATSSA